MDWNLLLQIVLPMLTGVVSWFAGRHTRHSNTLERMQETINLFVKENGELYSQLAEVRRENIILKEEQERLRIQIEELKKQLERMNT